MLGIHVSFRGCKPWYVATSKRHVPSFDAFSEMKCCTTWEVATALVVLVSYYLLGFLGIWVIYRISAISMSQNDPQCPHNRTTVGCFGAEISCLVVKAQAASWFLSASAARSYQLLSCCGLTWSCFMDEEKNPPSVRLPSQCLHLHVT